MNIKFEENVFEIEIKKAQKDGKKVYILGAALGGVRIAGGLKYRGLDFDAFIVDREYYVEGSTFAGKEILCVDDVQGTDCIVIRSIAEYPKLEKLKQELYVVDEDVLSLSMVASDPFDLAYVKDHIQELQSLYWDLQDEKSRQVLEAYINQKITGRFREMENVWDQIQYFDGDFYDLSRVHCMVDCGAFIGDSFLSFCNKYSEKTGAKFDGIAYLLDPDGANQQQIRNNCKKYEDNIRPMQLGAWYRQEMLSFQLDEHMRTAGKIVEGGNVQIQVDAIDNIVGELPVDFIKMDIEGSELNALKGAACAIRRCHPILAICVYHKREDLLEIPKYIKALYSDYKLYLRAYGGPYSIELVLYAIAEKFSEGQ